MTTLPDPYLEFRPLKLEMLNITSITGLTPEQVTLITAPFLPNEKPKAVATLESFSVTCDISNVLLPEHYRLRCWCYILGSAAQLAPLSYLPVPNKPLRSKLWRLLGGETEDSPSVTVSLAQSYPVARILVDVRGLLERATMFDPPDPLTRNP